MNNWLMRPVLTVAAGALIAASAAAIARAEDAAAGRLTAMATFLAKAERLTVSADCNYDVLQSSGQKIEFGERRVLALRRPDRARVDVTRRDGSRSGIVFDGSQLTAFDVDRQVYASVAKPGSVDAALTYFTQELHMRLPMRELFALDLPQNLKDHLSSARLVGTETIGGVATDHVAFRHDDVDVQLWIAHDGQPLPQRIVITYRSAAGQPQFAADFRDWRLDAELPDSVFTYTPAEGAKQIPILSPRGGRGRVEKQP